MLQIVVPPPPGGQSPSPAPAQSFLTTTEGHLTLAIIALAALVLLIQMFALRSRQASADDVIRGCSIIFIITGTLVLITAGYTNDQIAPALGLFGTIAGYLLGRKGSQ